MRVSIMALGVMAAAGSSWAWAAEPAVCVAVPEAETHLAVLLSPQNVVSVEALDGKRQDDPTVPPGVGARIVVASRAFVTADWLQHVIDCHLAARVATGGKANATQLPLDVDGARAHVTRSGGSLTVDVTAADARGAREILSRALALAPRAGGPHAP
jgi:hypothetical protein